MQKKKYYLEKNSTDEIFIEWGIFRWQKTTVSTVGGIIVNSITRKEINEGRTFELEGKGILFLQEKSKWIFIRQREVLFNGNVVPGTDTDPYRQIKQSYLLLFFVAAFNFLTGGICTMTPQSFLSSYEGYGMIFMGVILFVLACMVKYKNSIVALYIAIILFGLDGFLGLIFGITEGINPAPGIVMKTILLLHITNGIPALKKIKRENQ